MRTPQALAISALGCALALGVPGCTGPTPETAAREVFARYQDALFAGDRRAIRELLSTESRQVVPHLPFARLAGKQRLEVKGASRRDPEVLLDVADPNEGGARSTYVLVVEDGQLVVDLVASTAYNHETRPDPAGGQRLMTRPLTAAEMAQVRLPDAR